MKILLSDSGKIVSEWLSKYIISKIESDSDRYVAMFLLAFKSDLINETITSKIKFLTDSDGYLDLDKLSSCAKTVLRDSFNGKLHVSKFAQYDLAKMNLAYDVDSEDIDNIIEIARKYAR